MHTAAHDFYCLRIYVYVCMEEYTYFLALAVGGWNKI